ncbi:DNA-3-methyladenine glycosylase 2 family protein [Solimonas sp. C16B3]|uniref:DNA-3-methyladenine glycosylase II n=1 Tax=Solimonas marina TaxID=2714601 RepID=A0A969WD63_9GAMM|nr:DNA-3-methyladenine glycosylase 2 family protein [Solimonas marina]
MAYFTIAVRPPFPWRALLDYLATRLTEGLESIEDGCYRRYDGHAQVQVTYDAPSRRLCVGAGGLAPLAAARHVERLFQPQYDGRAVEAALAQHALFAARIERCPGFRPLGCWSPFELCVRTLIGQQVTVAAARTLMARLVARCGTLTPAAVRRADLTGIGMPGRRVAAIVALANAVAEDALDLDAGWPVLDARLAQQPGFGPWTRAYLAIRLGRDLDAFPEQDIGLLRAAGADSARALRTQSEAWRPYRGHAATLLWAVAP